MSEELEEQKASSSNAYKQFLTFEINEEEFAVDIMTVREIRGWTPPTRLPNTPEYMLGVINLRGIIIPIFDLKLRFGIGVTKPDKKNVVIILWVQGRTVGILVDAVSDIINTSVNEIKPAPDSSHSKVRDEFVSGLISIEERMVISIDLEKIFSAKEIDVKASAEIIEEKTAE